MQLSAKNLAELLGGKIEGDPEVVVNKPSRIEEGGAGTISFLGNEKYERYAYQTDASILLVSKDFTPRKSIQPTLIRVDNVYQSIAILLEKFGEPQATSIGISDSAVVDAKATLGVAVSVGPATVIEAGVEIGDHAQIGAQVYLGHNVKIGKHVVLYPGVKIMKDCEIGDHCIIHPNAVIGSDGFGYTPEADGSFKKVIHVGNVVVESDVEIGANAAIDRATIGSTFIRKGAKLDNLVHVGHNVEIGEHCAIAGQVGFAGSAKIGRQVRMGGQVGIAGHISIADGTQIQGQSGVTSTIKKPNTTISGSPAMAYNEFARSFIIFKKLPDLYRRLIRLEKASDSSQDPA